MDTGSTRLYVLRRADGLWDARETVGGPALTRPDTRRDALREARLMLERGRGGDVVVLAADGSVQRELHVEQVRRLRWWYVRPGAVRWLLPVLAVLQLVLRLIDHEPGTLHLVLTLGLVVVVLLTGVAALASRALDRRREPSDDVA